MPLLPLLFAERLLLFPFRLAMQTFTAVTIGKYHMSRTIEYQLNRIADIFHFVIDTVCELQELYSCHPNFFLCQLVQSPQGILNISLSK